MLIPNRPGVDVEALRTRFDGDVYGPDDIGWDGARRAWNLAVDQQPAVVALPVSDADVVAAVDFARDEGLRIAPQGTGHGAAARGSLEDAILLNMARMRGVHIDASGRRARVRAGALWADVTLYASAAGLAPLAGSSADVGVVGYTLGGGLSWLGRRYGLASNSVTAIEVVTADGRLVRADAEHEPDLFWALRGGGGSFGAVTAMEFELYPVSEVYAGPLMWPWERAREVLSAWRDWADTMPDDVTSLGRLLQIPPIPDVPPFLRGRQFVAVEAAVIGDEAYGRELLAPLRALQPEFDMVATMPAGGLIEIHNDPKSPVPGVGDHRMLAAAPDDALDALLAVAGPGSGSPLVSVELRQLGGALGRLTPGHGALGSLDGAYALYAVGVAPDAAAQAVVGAAIERVLEATAPWDAGRAYLNFVESPQHASRFFDEVTRAHLRAVKARVDPQDLFLSNHPIAPRK